MKKSVNNTKNLAFCSVISALSLVMMFLTGLIPVGTYAFPCIAGILLCVVVIESGYIFAFTTYFVVAVMSALFVADKEAALYYIAFLGYYPVLKGLVERIRIKAVSWLLKFALFNISVTGAFFVSITLLSVPKESFELFGVYLPWVFLVLGNIVFAVYDLCLTRAISEYVVKWRKKLKIR